MSITPLSTLSDVAFAVGTALAKHNVTGVLCGGSAATYYVPEAYQSRDLDFVLEFYGTTEQVLGAMSEAGFEMRGNMFFHTLVSYTVDFPKGPLGIGQDFITKWDTVLRGEETLNIVSPTDSCRDRLAGYFWFKDLGNLATAVAIARMHKVNLEFIRDWAAREAELEKFEVFAARLDL